MNLFEFINQEDLDDLPDDNEMAFLSLSQLTYQKLQVLENEIPKNTASTERKINEVRFRFINFILMAAKEYELNLSFSSESIDFSHFDSNIYNKMVVSLDVV